MKSGGTEKLVDSLDDACANLGISRAKGNREIAAGNLESYKDGRLRRVTRKAQAKYLALKQRQSGAKKVA